MDELHLGGERFDPTRDPLKAQLLSKLHMPRTTLVEPMRGGGCNAGMWILRGIDQVFVLKLTKSDHMFGRPSEAEKFINLSRSNPSIVEDSSVAFPCKIFQCLRQDGSKSHDLIVMRKVPGMQVSEIIRQILHSSPQELMGMLERFGNFLDAFHKRHNGLQHGDLTPANIYFDQASNSFTLIDVADLGPQNPVVKSDVQRFLSGLKGLSILFGQDIFSEGKARFEAGYNHQRSYMTCSL